MWCSDSFHMLESAAGTQTREYTYAWFLKRGILSLLFSLHGILASDRTPDWVNTALYRFWFFKSRVFFIFLKSDNGLMNRRTAFSRNLSARQWNNWSLLNMWFEKNELAWVLAIFESVYNRIGQPLSRAVLQGTMGDPKPELTHKE